jgi:PPM family protein phosphatase
MPAPMPDVVAQAAARSDLGRVRESNEDRVLLLDEVSEQASLYAIADGLGGHAGGDVASRLAVDTLGVEVPSLLKRGVSPREALAWAFRRANSAIRDGARDAGRAGMATTCTAVLLHRGVAIVAHVGDSRAYLLRGETATQLTQDHSLVGELARHGALALGEVEHHAQRHLLTRALGIDEEVVVDSTVEPLHPGDLLVLTTDGLHNAVSAEELARVVRTAPSLDEACRALVGLANARGGMDNATVIVIRIASRWPRRAISVVAPLVLATFVAGGVAAYRLEHAYFLGVVGDRVAVMRGVPGRLLGVPLSGVIKVTEIPVTRVAPDHRGRLLRGIPTASPEAAEGMLPGLLGRPAP